MKIKICGIKRSEDVGFANLFMPDYIGFILSKGYKRTVKIDDAKFLAAKADLKIKKVGVFVDMPAKNVASVADYTGIDIIQLHGENEDNDYINELRKYTDKEIWNVFKVKNEEEVLKAEKSIADMILLDTYSEKIEGGTVIIRTREKADCYEITVLDDGVGFDVNNIDKSRTHVGMENVKARITNMCNGEIDIKSTLGVGTEATIRIYK